MRQLTGTSHDITITINGAEDASVITVGSGDSDSGSVTEDVDTDAGTAGIQLEQAGTLTVTDADTGDTAAFDPSATSLKSTTHTGQLGTLSIDASGNWDYSVDNTNVQFLDVGETIIETYTVEATDGTSHDITITINGAEDPSVITVGSGDSDTGSVTEDVDTDAGTAGVQLEQAGTLTVTDADTGDTAAFDPSATSLKSTTHTGQLGTLSIDAGGNWDYSADNATVQFLDIGETIIETYTVESTDGANHDITITINGAEDPSVITVGSGDSDSGIVTEDVDTDAGTAGIQLEQTGTLTVTDADSGDTAAFDPSATSLKSTTHTGQLGTLSIDAGGNWDYSVDNATVQFLDVGETVIETYSVEATDGTSHDITITINGAEDPSVITVGSGDADAGSVTEDVDTDAGTAGIQLEQAGTLTVTDADTGDTAAFDPSATSLKSTTHTGQLGMLSIDAGGDWDYSVDNATVQFLDVGETVIETYTVESTDGTSHDITITINGAEDLSEITVGSGDSDTGSVTEDVDTDAGTAGIQLEQDGTLTVTDADTGDTAAFDPSATSLKSTTHTGQLGTLSIDASGNWDYSVDNATVQFLDVGETVIETYTVEATDGTSHDITITINGAEDPSVITVGSGDSDSGSVTEDVDTDAGTAGIQLEQAGTLTVTDADTGDTAAFDPSATSLKSTTHTGQLGTLSIDASGNWDYSVDNTSVQFLDVGETVIETYTVEATDGTSHDITLTINGAEDPSVITVGSGDSDSGSVTEDVDTDAGTAGVQLEQVGTLTVTDADTGDTAAFDPSATSLKSTTHTGQLGTLSIDASGNWDYSVDNANVQFLNTGETIIETYTVESTDGTSHDITITINGVDEPNTAPTLSGTTTTMVYESGLAEGTGNTPTTTLVSGTLTYNDADGDALTLAVDGTDLGVLDGNAATVLGSVAGEDGSGTLTVYGDGSWQYQLQNNVVHDGNDASYLPAEFEDFVITVKDPMMATSSPATLTINIVDDTIEVATPAAASFSNEAGSTHTGALTTDGADNDTYSASLASNIAGWNGTTVTWASSGLTTDGGYPVYYYVDPADESQLIAYRDDNFASPSEYDPSNPTQSLVFTLDADPNSDSYDMEMFAPIDSASNLNFNFSALSASGPDNTWQFSDAPAIYTTAETIPVGETLVFTATAENDDLGTVQDVNKNNNYMGIDNMWVEGDEVGLEFDIINATSSIAFDINYGGGTGGETINYVAYAPDDTTVVASGSWDAGGTGNGTLTITTGGVFIGRVELDTTNTTVKWQIGAINLGTTAGNDTVNLNYAVDLTDSDGDTTSTTFDFTLTPPTPPVVIDMDGDGVEFDNIAEGIAYDIDGDGQLEQTAWADEDDAVLIYDANDNNDVDGREEFAFADYSQDPDATDMEGLQEAFDSNADGILSAEDEDWEQFKLWQDADGDGEVGEGEMISLDEAGIESIGLVSDGESYDTADGDVHVHGESEVIFTDGSTGVAADAEFDFTDLIDGSDSADDLEIITDSGEVMNLDEESGLDAAPADPAEGGFDDVETGQGSGPSPDDDAAQAAAETGL